MKRVTAISLTALALSSFAAMAAPKFSVDRIDPPHWWTSMNDHSLQLQVYGKDIRPADFSVDYPGVTVDSVVRLDGSNNWQHIYLTIAPDAKPGTMQLRWKENGKTVTKPYELRARRQNKGAKGFTSADVLYLVMPDRFADGNPSNNNGEGMKFPVTVDRSNPNARHGGDFVGVNQHLDYIDSLGVTVVWFNPVLENDMPGGSYHGYATTDYYQVDPRFGTNDEYTEVIESLHDRGIKTVMDMIFNHCGSEHPWVNDAPASDWFNYQDNYVQTNYHLPTMSDPYASHYDKDLTLNGWFVQSMPDLNQKNPHLWKYLVQNSIWWIEESQIDGIRQDTYAYIEPEIMATWNEAVLREYPDFNIVGECWLSDPAGIAYWQKNSAIAAANGVDTKLPVIMDFPLMIKMRNMEPMREETQGQEGLNTIYNHLALDFIYADVNNLLRFLDNHDTERFITAPVENLDQWKQAIAMLLTVPGIPQLYYGTELLMNGTREGGDGNVRKDIPGGFPGDTENQFSAAGRSQLQNEAYDYISTINHWRKNSKAAATGKMTHYQPNNGLYVASRKADDDQFILVMNGTNEPLELDMTRYQEVAAPGETFTDILTGEEVVLVPNEGKKSFSPRQTLILQKR